MSAGPRLTATGAAYADLATHVRCHGPLPATDAAHIIDIVERSGLTGRGGAAFPTGRKLRTVAGNARRSGAVLIANGCEGEPASAKDRSMLMKAPHLILDGITLGARSVGADHAYLCVHEGQDEVLRTLQGAQMERRAAGLPDVEMTVTEVPNRYVASEESSLVHLLNGGPSLPLSTPPRPFERGVQGRPTLVDNVETLAQLALTVRHGADWFRSAGTSDAPGTALVTLGGAVAAPGVYEVELGLTGADLLAVAGGPSEPLQAVLAGGYFGAWLRADRFAASAITPRGLQAAGAAMGAGIFLALPATSCGLAETARIAQYLAEQSANQCGPCLNGLPALAEALTALAHRGGRKPSGTITALSPYVTGRGACRHPDGAVRLINSALTEFAADVRTHAQRGPCQGLRRAPILPVPTPERASARTGGRIPAEV
ncbi:NADH-ubiquinone oxidoreductase-F iron-sulfur binding region domain-containing protein [Catenulispora pinisilvae]|uniref:NADH-ubiquinone oxidoreductase-F iron-sulfur binding region domain-containing protein n=1 Tax=Catenulispora pinisilvae TaxID=2705253 RepID=UPI001891B207|nr:NADH-ubiquinone oxidoreductase-F iron-sulfur binding region domain-containing protein [Catenulispora pinisilvae]